MTLTATKV